MSESATLTRPMMTAPTRIEVWYVPRANPTTRLSRLSASPLSSSRHIRPDGTAVPWPGPVPPSRLPRMALTMA